jgi:hypothetical protein
MMTDEEERQTPRMRIRRRLRKFAQALPRHEFAHARHVDRDQLASGEGGEAWA